MNPSQATRRGALLLPVMLSFLLSASLPAAPRQELSAPADIQGVPCRGPVRFHDNGRLAACTLARAAEVGGFLLPAGTEVFFTPGGEWSELVLGAEATVFHLALPAGSRVFAASRFESSHRLISVHVRKVHRRLCFSLHGDTFRLHECCHRYPT